MVKCLETSNLGSHFHPKIKRVNQELMRHKGEEKREDIKSQNSVHVRPEAGKHQNTPTFLFFHQLICHCQWLPLDKTNGKPESHLMKHHPGVA